MEMSKTEDHILYELSCYEQMTIGKLWLLNLLNI